MYIVDQHGILDPADDVTFDSTPEIKAKHIKNMHNCFAEDALAFNTIHYVSTMIMMKMLKIFGDENAHCYKEICKILFPDKKPSHDIDTFRSLIDREMLVLSHRQDRNAMYVITEYGKEVLDVCRKNEVFNRPMKWFKMPDDKMFNAMINADLDGDCNDNSVKDDISSQAVLDLVKAFFDPKSGISTLQSKYRWMNIFMKSLKNNSYMNDVMDSDEINNWLEANKHKAEVARFSAKVHKIRKSWKNKKKKETSQLI